MNQYPFGLCDLHCDTLYELPKNGTHLYNTAHHISFDRVDAFTSYTQVMALWSNVRFSDDECYRMYRDNYAYYQKELALYPSIVQCRTAAELEEAWKTGKKATILAVEGGNLLGEDLSRLDTLYNDGVRFFTLVWGGESRMGGAHDVGGGLSPFGIQALKKLLALGIIPDVSHASKEIFYQTAAYCDMAGKPFVATHSDSDAVFSHTRNLTDEQFRKIRDAGGLVGINLCTFHLQGTEDCPMDKVLDHMEHYLSLGGEKTVCMGGDLDGIGLIPGGMRNNGDLPMLCEAMSARGFSDALIADIFENNVKRFLRKNL